MYLALVYCSQSSHSCFGSIETYEFALSWTLGEATALILVCADVFENVAVALVVVVAVF